MNSAKPSCPRQVKHHVSYDAKDQLWLVEADDVASTGRVLHTFFPLVFHGEERAREYAAWKNGEITTPTFDVDNPSTPD